MSTLHWQRSNPGHYIGDWVKGGDRYEVFVTGPPRRWEWSDRMTGANGTERSLKAAKAAIEET